MALQSPIRYNHDGGCTAGDYYYRSHQTSQGLREMLQFSPFNEILSAVYHV